MDPFANHIRLDFQMQINIDDRSSKLYGDARRRQETSPSTQTSDPNNLAEDAEEYSFGSVATFTSLSAVGYLLSTDFGNRRSEKRRGATST